MQMVSGTLGSLMFMVSGLGFSVGGSGSRPSTSHGSLVHVSSLKAPECDSAGFSLHCSSFGMVEALD